MNHFNQFLAFSGLGALFGFSHVLIAPVLPPYIKSFGFTEFQVGLIFAMFGLSLIFISPMIGRISDHIGRKRIIIFGLVVFIASMMIYFVGNNWLAFALGRIFEAIGSVAVGLIALAKVEDFLKNKERGKYTGINQSINQIGVLLAFLVSGYVAVKFSPRAPFALSAMMIGLLFFILLFWNIPKKTKISKQDFNLIDEWRSFWRIPQLRAMGIIGISVHGAGSAFWIFLPIFIVEHLQKDYAFVAYMFFAMGFFHIFQFYFGKLADKWGRERFILGGVLGLGISSILLMFATEFYHVILIVLVHSLAGAMFNTASWTFMSNIAEKVKHEGEYLGSYLSFAKMGSFSFQILGGLIITLLGYSSYFLLNGVVQILLLLIASRYIFQRPQSL